MPDECSICLDEIAVATTGCVQLSCSHTYHLGCISRWYQTNPSCPECRCAPAEKEAPPASRLTEIPYSLTTNHLDHFTFNLPSMTRGNTSNITPEQMYQISRALLSNNQNANAPAATPEETMDRDVRLVSSQAGVPLDVARNVLEQCQGDIVTAIMEITMGLGSSVNVSDTFDLPELEG